MEDVAAGISHPEAGVGIAEVVRPIIGRAHEAHAPAARVRKEGLNTLTLVGVRQPSDEQ